jgi:hypothetical protein
MNWAPDGRLRAFPPPFFNLLRATGMFEIEPILFRFRSILSN